MARAWATKNYDKLKFYIFQKMFPNHTVAVARSSNEARMKVYVFACAMMSNRYQWCECHCGEAGNGAERSDKRAIVAPWKCLSLPNSATSCKTTFFHYKTRSSPSSRNLMVELTRSFDKKYFSENIQ